MSGLVPEKSLVQHPEGRISQALLVENYFDVCPWMVLILWPHGGQRMLTLSAARCIQRDQHMPNELIVAVADRITMEGIQQQQYSDQIFFQSTPKGTCRLDLQPWGNAGRGEKRGKEVYRVFQDCLQ